MGDPTNSVCTGQLMAGSRRTTPLPSDWPRTRARILRRDHYRCRSCGQPARDVDHVVPGHLGGSDDDNNLQALCGPCHATKTGREAQAVQPRRRRAPEAHPGLTAAARHGASPGGGGWPPPGRPETRRG